MTHLTSDELIDAMEGMLAAALFAHREMRPAIVRQLAFHGVDEFVRREVRHGSDPRIFFKLASA